MPLSQEDVDSLIKRSQDEFRSAWKNKDAKRIAELYHPQAQGPAVIWATLVMSSDSCYFGRQAIQKTFESCLAHAPAEYELHTELSAEAANGEYLITRGFCSNSMVEKSNYERILRKEQDGTYLIYHEQCNV
ncbi:hypothetical protein DdX_14829 [Ditylenchus destructor]|uniref:Uncharacterized protein n=1 Tax=Ditylenchus destructor TaxID=166010 RepID=A0AAD4QY97_9BILA|nr:hypothetical protein DdX_14827 [Ditylenchus destructor]KAI1703592.1 hypothetical protein DdX_14829 [Ditylenchus destructor]